MAQVKMDRIRFAQLIGWLCMRTGYTFNIDEVVDIDSALVFDIPDEKAKPADVDELLKQFSAIDGFIGAIKAYRTLTGEGLKEAKEAIERYRYTTGLEQFKKRALEKLDDHGYSKLDYDVIKSFIENL